MEQSSNQTVLVGMDVPDFTIETYEPATGTFGRVSLNEFRLQGLWTVLVFYPADFTFVCPTELADIGEHLDEIQALGVKVISISADTKFAHLAWRNSEKMLQNVRFTMGADPAGAASKLFGVYDDFSGLARRGTIIISPEGKLVSVEVSYYNMGRDAGELMRRLKAITYLAKHPDEACPAKWQPGQQTLKPSEKMVGHVFEAMNK